MSKSLNLPLNIHWINQQLSWRVETIESHFVLFNQFGYAGRFDTLELALIVDKAMNIEPSFRD